MADALEDLLPLLVDAALQGDAERLDALSEAIEDNLADESEGLGDEGPQLEEARKRVAGDMMAFVRGRLVSRRTESCEPNRSGPGHHDSETGHPCKTGGDQANPDAGRPTRAPAAPAAPRPAPARKGLLGRVASALGLGGKPKEPAGPPFEAVKPLSVAGRMEASPAYQGFGQKLDKGHAPGWEALAHQHHKGDVEKAKADVASRCQKLADSLHVYSRVKEDVLPLILEGGFKNQFQTGRSQALYDPKGRAAAEEKGMGLPPDTPAAERPVYGYLSSGSADDLPDMDRYGAIAVRLKASARTRTTVSMGDSLRGATNGEFQACPLASVDHRAINPGDVAATGLDSLDSFQGWNAKHKTYIEAQIQGGVGPADIDSVEFSQEPAEPLRRKLEALNIPWSVR